MDRATIEARRASLLTDLQTVETATQRAQAQVQQGAVQAERLRGAIALCDELLAPSPDDA